MLIEGHKRKVIMKQSIIWGSLLGMLMSWTWAQEAPASTLGLVHTPKGHLHMLIVFVRYEDKKLFDSDRWPDSSEPGELPYFAVGDRNLLYYPDTTYFDQEIRTHNLSDFFYTMSDGKFKITADIYPRQVPIKHQADTRAAFFSRQGRMNQEAINWIANNDPDFDWSRYDNRTNNANFRYDNSTSGPDSLLDYVIFMHRAPGLTGIGSTGNVGVAHTPYRITNGHTAIECYADVEHNWRYMTHEMAHNFFSAPHYMGANHADGFRYYLQKGWGMMCGWGTPFFSANAWECWWQGWIDPQPITENGTYTLGDFLTTKDAMSIPIPGSQDVLWIENRQKLDPWDAKLFYNDTLNTDQQLSAKGLYMYVVSGVGTDREKVRLNPFDKKHVNFIKTMHGRGNFDYEILPEKYEGKFWVFREKRSNPFAGQNEFQSIRYDKDGNGRIDVQMRHGNKDRSKREEIEIWVKEEEGGQRLRFHATGSAEASFVPGDEISLSGIVPVTNFPLYTPSTQTLSPYIISGLQIKVLRQNEDGSMDISVNFDDWEVRSDQFWSGELYVPADPDSAQSRTLTLAPKATLELGLSETPQRQTPHPETGTFANPTKLSLASGTGILLQKKSTFIIEAFSEVLLSEGATLELAAGSELIIRPGGKLILHDRSQLSVHKKAKLITPVDEEGIEVIHPGP